jgi:hypothetical protein
VANDPLRGCPTCGTRVHDLDLGLRDFRWVSSHLPGNVAPMDIDFVLERKGKVLMGTHDLSHLREDGVQRVGGAGGRATGYVVETRVH